jgi:nitrilase
MSSRFAAAVIQSAPVVFEPKATLAKVRDLTADASKQGAKLVVFPEAFVSAYPKGRDDFRKYFDSAIDVPGRATQELSRAAKESGV